MNMLKLMWRDFIHSGIPKSALIVTLVVIFFTLIFPFNVWILDEVYPKISILDEHYVDLGSEYKGMSLIEHYNIIPESIEATSIKILLPISFFGIGILTTAFVLGPFIVVGAFAIMIIVTIVGAIGFISGTVCYVHDLRERSKK